MQTDRTQAQIVGIPRYLYQASAGVSLIFSIKLRKLDIPMNKIYGGKTPPIRRRPSCRV